MSLFFIALILGCVEGLTEFIPVSSTGHLILVGHLLNFHGSKAQTFEIAIQTGAILAAFFYIFKFSKPRDIYKFVLYSTLPALALGFLLHSSIKHYLFAPTPVAIDLGLGGLMMILTEK